MLLATQILSYRVGVNARLASEDAGMAQDLVNEVFEFGEAAFEAGSEMKARGRTVGAIATSNSAMANAIRSCPKVYPAPGISRSHKGSVVRIRKSAFDGCCPL